MSKKNAPAKTPAKAPAKKLNLLPLLPAVLLLIGLVIMTVCFVNVNSQLAETRAALIDAQNQLAAQSTATMVVTGEAVTVADTDDVLATLEAALADANAALAAKDEELSAQAAELDAAMAEIAEKDALLAVANDAIAQTMELLNQIAAPAPEAPVDEAVEAPVEEIAEVVEEPAEAPVDEAVEAPEAESEAAAE